MYDAVGFRWSTLFTVGWNVVVAVAALALMVTRRRTVRDRAGYQEIGGDDDSDEEPVKEAEKFTGEVQNNLNYTDSYQTL